MNVPALNVKVLISIIVNVPEPVPEKTNFLDSKAFQFIVSRSSRPHTRFFGLGLGLGHVHDIWRIFPLYSQPPINL